MFIGFEAALKTFFTKNAALRRGTALQEHQKRVAERVQDGGGLLLYHGLGSGKTLSAINATEGDKTDVVTPAALRGNFAKEIEKHTDRKTPRQIISYEKATKGGLPGGDALVVDEVQRINNPSAARTKAILEAAKNYRKRLVLSGTPIRNHPYEIAPILRTIDPDSSVPLDQDAFNKRFIEERSISPGFIARLRGIQPGTRVMAKNLDQFRSLVRGRVDYHMPEQTDFPRRTERVVSVPMSSEQSDVYDTVTNKANPVIAYKVRKNLPLSKRESANLNAYMSGARMVSNTSRPFGGQGVSPKFQRATEDVLHGLKANPNFKAVAYSNYLDGGVNEYARLLQEKNVPHAVFSGELGDKERKKVVDDYNAGRIRALLISGAGAEGLDLKGTRMMQVLEPHWNEARTEQAIGRAIRYKSHEHLPENEREVDVVRYHSVKPRGFWNRLLGTKPATTADEYLYNLSKEKSELNNQFLNVLKAEGEAYNQQYAQRKSETPIQH